MRVVMVKFIWKIQYSTYRRIKIPATQKNATIAKMKWVPMRRPVADPPSKLFKTESLFQPDQDFKAI